MNDVELAIKVAEVGAAVVRRRFGTPLRLLNKGDGDFATSADIEAENAMLDFITRERPEDVVFAEESGRTGATAGSRTWLVDPLCGTLNYAMRMRIAAVNVALRVGKKFVAAAVADPFSAEIFWANDTSAFVRLNGADLPLKPSDSLRLVDLNFDPPFPNADAFKVTSLASDSEFTDNFRPRVVSSTIALTWVATGQRAAYVTDGDLRESVHFAAGLAICEAAGCTLTDLQGRSWDSGATGLVAAANPEVHATLVRLIQKYFR